MVRLFLYVSRDTLELIRCPDENIPPIEFKTPSAARYRDALAPVTPKHRVRLPGKPLTPRTPRTCSTPLSTCATIYSDARQLFAQNGSPMKLIGRDAERNELATFISKNVEAHSGGSIYVSGPPGTGKSALVEEITKDYSSTPNLHISVVNCVSIKSSKGIQRKIISDLHPDDLESTKSEHSILSHLFLSKRKSELQSFLVVLDEVDNLLSIDCELLYTLFEWALHRSSRLILIGIANALDLTDRFLPRLKARNLKPQLLPFMPYSAPQITSIVTEKLRSTLPADCSKGRDYVPFLHPAAIQLCSKKVASQTGDLRKVFNLVRRAIDCIERETVEKHSALDLSPTKQPLVDITNTSPTKLPPSPPSSSPLKPGSPSPASACHQLDLSTLTAETAPRATVAHVARLASAVFNNDTISRLNGLNLQQKAVLCSLVAAEKKRVERDPFSTPSKNANKKPMLKDLFGLYSGLCKRENVLCPLSSTEFRDVVTSLDTLGLVQEASARASFFTPTRTPSRLGKKSIEEKQFVSTVSEKELDENLQGPGTEILKRLLHGESL
jgi:cell division control protein 6